MSTMGPILGIDVGGTKIAAILVDHDDHVLAARVVPTDERTLDAQVLDAAASILDGRAPMALGIAAPGQVDTESGVVRMAVNVSLPAIPLASIVQERLGVPAFVDHDTRAAAAWLLQRDGGSGSFAYVSVGTGISAAVAIDGRLLRGVSGLAGEIGHVVALPGGPACACGLQGCLEAVASGPAVARRAAEAVDAGETTSLRADAGPADVYHAAEAGDPVALRIAAEVGGYLARAIRGIVLAYGIDRVVLGGGLTRAGQSFLQPILDALELERSQSALVRQALPPAVLELLDPDTQPGAWGAVVIARSGLAAARSEPSDSSRGREVANG